MSHAVTEAPPETTVARAFVPWQSLCLLEEDTPEGFIDFVATGDWRGAEWKFLVLCARFDESRWYLFSRAEFTQAADAFPYSRRREMLRDLLRRFFQVDPDKAVPAGLEVEAPRWIELAIPADQIAPDQVPQAVCGVWVEPEVVKRPPVFFKGRGPFTYFDLRPLSAGTEWRAPIFLPSFGSRGFSASEAARRRDSLGRTPHVDLVGEQQEGWFVGQEIGVEVYVDDAQFRAGEEGEGIELRFPDGVDSLPLSVWLQASEALEIVGASVQPLILHRGEKRSEPARFDVRFAENSGSSSASLTAIFSHNHRPCGRVSRLFTVGEGTRDRLRPAQELGSLSEPPSSPGGVGTAPPAPDLTLYVRRKDDNPSAYHVWVTSPWPLPAELLEPKEWAVRGGASTMMTAFFARFTQRGISAEERRRRLDGNGRKLFREAPRVFQDAFWELRRMAADPTLAARLPASLKILVVTDEPQIAWELMVPNSPALDRGAEDDELPIGAAHCVGRWSDPAFRAPPRSLQIRGAVALAPDYTDPSCDVPPLVAREKELDLLRRLFGLAEISPATAEELDAQLPARKPTLLHALCHGRSEPDAVVQTIALRGGVPLGTDSLEGMDGVRKALRESAPLVFFNACEVGREIPLLVGNEGFGPLFIRYGASAVIAPLWSVRDSVAYKVAEFVYHAISSPASEPIAAILRDVRGRAYRGGEAGEDTYAAYVFYGDPWFTASH